MSRRVVRVSPISSASLYPHYENPSVMVPHGLVIFANDRSLVTADWALYCWTAFSDFLA